MEFGLYKVLPTPALFAGSWTGCISVGNLGGGGGAHTHTHTHDENRKQEQSKKSGEGKILRSRRAALDVFRSVDRR